MGYLDELKQVGRENVDSGTIDCYQCFPGHVGS